MKEFWNELLLPCIGGFLILAGYLTALFICFATIEWAMKLFGLMK